MTNKLTSLAGFGEGDPKPEKNRALSSINRHARRHGERLSTTEAGEKKYHARKAGVKLSAKEQHYGSAKSKALSKKSGSKNPNYAPGTAGSRLTQEEISERVKNWDKKAGKNHDIMGS